MKRNIPTKVQTWKIVCYSSYIPEEVGREEELVGDSLENALSAWINTIGLMNRLFSCRIYRCNKGTMIKFKRRDKKRMNHVIRFLVVE